MSALKITAGILLAVFILFLVGVVIIVVMDYSESIEKERQWRVKQFSDCTAEYLSNYQYSNEYYPAAQALRKYYL